jgi:hypothetical protein
MPRRTSAFSRRRLLTGLGATAAALPLLGRIPSAEAQDFPRRFVVFVSPNEPIEKKYWLPGPSFSLTDVMEPLEPFKDKLVLLGDMKMHTRDKDGFGGGHVGIGHLLTGEVNVPYGPENYDFWAGGISVDQFIAGQLGVEALTLAARPGGANGNCRISYSGASAPVHPFEDPQKAFDQLLGGYTLPPDELAALRAQKKTVLDSVAKQLGGVHGKLGQADREKLERHLELVKELEGSLAGGGTLSCSPTSPTGGYDFQSNSDYPTTSRRHMDVLVQALACDVTRVATLQLGNSGASNLTPKWPDFGVDVSVDEHNVAHNYNSAQNATTIAQREAVERFYYAQFAYLLEQLDSVEEGEGTLLDNTVVLWAKPIGRNHSGDQLLFMLAGSGGGSYSTGRYIELEDVPHNNLLVTCCHLMGLTDVESFGDPELCTGAVSL